MGYNISKAERTKFEEKLFIYEGALEILKSKIAIVNIEYNRILNFNDSLNKIEKITSRVKSIDSIAGKLEKNDLEFNEENIESKVHDVVGVRIVGLTLNDIHVIIGLIHNNLKLLNEKEGFEVIKEKDYINNPKESGYQGYHFQIEVPVRFSSTEYKVAAEIQVRTSAMDAWSTLEHKYRYKSKEEVEILKASFQTYANIVEHTDRIIALNNQQQEATAKVKRK